ncbi:MAG: hypothetical protein ACJ77B_02900 [Chloroflexota bacterium]
MDENAVRNWVTGTTATAAAGPPGAGWLGGADPPPGSPLETGPLAAGETEATADARGEPDGEGDVDGVCDPQPTAIEAIAAIASSLRTVALLTPAIVASRSPGDDGAR